MPARHAAAFDTLTYAKKLEEAGFTPQQAEVQAFALADIVDERLATKEDIRRVEGVMATHRFAAEVDIKRLEEVMKANRIAAEKDTKANRLAAEHDTALIRKDIEQIHLKIETLREGTRKDIETLREGTKKDIETMRLSLIIWLGGIVVASAVASVGLIATLIRLGT